MSTIVGARGALRLRVRTIGRPSQPDLGNTSVGKLDDSGSREIQPRSLPDGEAAFLLHEYHVGFYSAHRPTMKGSLYEHPD